MLYGFAPSGDRTFIDIGPMHYVKSEPHPTRLMDIHDIFFLIDGYWNVLLEDEMINIKPGDIVLLPAHYHHYGDEKCRAHTRTIFIHFSMEKTDRVVKETENVEKNLLLVQSLTHANTEILHYFQDITKIYWSNVPYKEMRCRSLLNLLLSELFDIYRHRDIKKDTLILELVDFITNQPNKFFTIEELAEKAALSPKSLTSRFRAETGQSVHKYQINRKLDQIASLLRSESYTSLKNLALNFGFYDEFHLSSSFKKKFGVSPNKYTS
ncbi:hypothetical protein FACS189479_04660 [Spirochaetia bacterium]|nr:hypothetical protein FACS189479_04660 [Spirochaetia bacterium]